MARSTSTVDYVLGGFDGPYAGTLASIIGDTGHDGPAGSVGGRRGRRAGTQDIPTVAPADRALQRGTARRSPTSLPRTPAHGCRIGVGSTMARAHPHTKLYTPLGLGEILARRTFTASGELNPLVLGKNSSTASSNQALRLLGQEFVPADDPQWVPPSLITLLDGIEASKWAWILVGIGEEEHIIAYRQTGLWAGSDRGPPSSMLIGTTGSCADGAWPWT